MELDIAVLCAELSSKLPGNPNTWTLLGSKFHAAIASFARKQYALGYKDKAIDRVKKLSDKEVRDRLLKLVEDNPDVGLGILA